MGHRTNDDLSLPIFLSFREIIFLIAQVLQQINFEFAQRLLRQSILLITLV